MPKRLHDQSVYASIRQRVESLRPDTSRRWGKVSIDQMLMYAASTHDFDAQKAGCLALIDRIVARPLDAAWPDSASMGRMQGKHWSQLTAKHLDHHLRQFGS